MGLDAHAPPTPPPRLPSPRYYLLLPNAAPHTPHARPHAGTAAPLLPLPTAPHLLVRYGAACAVRQDIPLQFFSPFSFSSSGSSVWILSIRGSFLASAISLQPVSRAFW